MKKYNAKPGYRMVAWPEFPIETDDPVMQAKIEGSKAFKDRGNIWLMEAT